MTAGYRHLAKKASVLPLLVVLWLGWQVAPVHAAPGDVAELAVNATVDREGGLRVEQTMTFDESAPPEVRQRIATIEDAFGDARYQYEVTDVMASAGGQQVAAEVNDSGDAVEVIIPTAADTEAVTLSYHVEGAVRESADGTTLAWRFLQGLSVPVAEVTASVAVPGLFTYIDCSAGPPTSSVSCGTTSGGTHETGATPTFRDGPRGPGEVVAIEIGFPAGLVAPSEQLDYRWSMARGFSAEPLQLGLALAVLILGGVLVAVLHRRAGADLAAGQRIEPVAEFAAVGEDQVEFRVISQVRPGEVGTMADERVDPIDVVGTVIDLAVRGYVRITELPAASHYAPADWTFTRLDKEVSGLQPYEGRLLEAVAPLEGPATKVSTVSSKVAEVVPQVQSELYDEMVSNGWYDHRPDQTRSRWHRVALIGLVGSVALTAALGAFTTFGLLGLAVVVVVLGLLFVAQEMPARTAKGSAALRGLNLLNDELHSRATVGMAKGRELEVISRVLPYAIVLGGADRWIDAMIAADDDDDLPDPTDLDWYHAPDDWHLADLPDSLRNLTVTLSGVLFARP